MRSAVRPTRTGCRSGLAAAPASRRSPAGKRSQTGRGEIRVAALPLASPGPRPRARGSGTAQLLLPRGPPTPRENSQEAAELGTEGVYFTGQARGREPAAACVWGRSPQRRSLAPRLGAGGGRRGRGGVSGRSSSCPLCRRPWPSAFPSEVLQKALGLFFGWFV